MMIMKPLCAFMIQRTRDIRNNKSFTCDWKESDGFVAKCFSMSRRNAYRMALIPFPLCRFISFQ